MGDRLELDFQEAARELIPDGTRLLVATSGGGDSVALLRLLHRSAPTRRLDLVVAHLDHALRSDSGEDRRFVERLASELHLPCHSERREVAGLRRSDESPEEGARRVRRDFLLEAADRSGCGLIAMGHTLDDQAETVLMRLVRGAGATALTGMACRGPGPFVRPLLRLERAALRGWLERHELAFRDDPTNEDQRFDRNRVRQRVLPLLNDALNPRAARHIVQAVERFREDAEHLDREAREILTTVAERRASGALELDAVRLGGLAPALGQRVARLALIDAGADARRIGARHVAALLDLARGGNRRRADLPGGMTARRDRKSLFLEKP